MCDRRLCAAAGNHEFAKVVGPEIGQQKTVVFAPAVVQRGHLSAGRVRHTGKPRRICPRYISARHECQLIFPISRWCDQNVMPIRVCVCVLTDRVAGDENGFARGWSVRVRPTFCPSCPPGAHSRGFVNIYLPRTRARRSTTIAATTSLYLF